MWPVHPDGGETYQVTGDPRITDLYLPTRRFWVLTRDRYDDASGTFASRGAPRLGETFLLLCREECQEQLHILKDEGLLDWDDDPVDVPGGSRVGGVQGVHGAVRQLGRHYPTDTRIVRRASAP